MHAALTAFSRHLAAETRAPRTIGTYNAIIAAFFTFWRHEPGSSPTPTRSDVEAFLGRGRQDGAPRASTTRNQELATLRVFAAFARRDLGWSSDPTQGVPFVREPPRIPAVLSAEELQHSFRTVAAVPDPEERACNLAILALLSQTGLRVHELVQLDVDQVDLATATLLRVEGKGGTVRELPLNDRALALVGNWLKERPKWATPDEQALLVSSRGSRISARTVERRIEQLRQTMQLPKKATPHSFRHTFATLELMAGTDLVTLAELLGHTDINTTARYLHWIDTRRREAVRRLAYTVPAEVLPLPPASEPAVPSQGKEPLPTPPETPAIPREIVLDDEHSLGDAA